MKGYWVMAPHTEEIGIVEQYRFRDLSDPITQGDLFTLEKGWFVDPILSDSKELTEQDINTLRDCYKALSGILEFGDDCEVLMLELKEEGR